MGNFSYEENTEPDIGGSHETVLVLFQKSEDKTPEFELIMSSMFGNLNGRILSHTMPFLLLIKSRTFGKSGNIAYNFEPLDSLVDNRAAHSAHNDFLIWAATRSTLVTTKLSVIPNYIVPLKEFFRRCTDASGQFQYWSNSLQYVVSLLKDITLSQRYLTLCSVSNYKFNFELYINIIRILSIILKHWNKFRFINNG